MSEPYTGMLGKELLVPLYEGSIPYVTEDGWLTRAYPTAVYVFKEVRPAKVPEGCSSPSRIPQDKESGA